MARPLMLLVALVGLFAMHGLSDHGTSAHVAMPLDAPVSAAHSVAPAISDAAEVLGQEPSGHSDMGLAGLCLGILVAAVLGFAFLRRRTMAYLGSWSPSLARPWRRSAGRDRDPPDLLRLSIQRC